MSDVSIALIGSGFVAEFYMQGLANVPGHKVVANYSQGGERARQFGRRWSIAESTTDLEKLIGRRDIDLYIIALPNQVHLPVSLELSRAKKNQVCTKPLGRTRAEAKAMCAMRGQSTPDDRARRCRPRALGTLAGIAQRTA
jgi:predicted dehydrogenase